MCPSLVINGFEHIFHICMCWLFVHFKCLISPFPDFRQLFSGTNRLSAVSTSVIDLLSAVRLEHIFSHYMSYLFALMIASSAVQKQLKIEHLFVYSVCACVSRVTCVELAVFLHHVGCPGGD